MPLNSDFDLLAFPIRWTSANCPCCALSCLDIRLHAALALLDELLPTQFTITCITRCRAQNAAVGGVNDSLHLLGRAADLAPRHIDLYRLLAAALTTPAFETGGIGLYPDRGIIHVDVRPRPARWAKVGHQTTEFVATWKSLWPNHPPPDRLLPSSPLCDPPSPAWR
jgi:hypothetical protein